MNRSFKSLFFTYSFKVVRCWIFVSQNYSCGLQFSFRSQRFLLQRLFLQSWVKNHLLLGCTWSSVTYTLKPTLNHKILVFNNYWFLESGDGKKLSLGFSLVTLDLMISSGLLCEALSNISSVCWHPTEGDGRSLSRTSGIGVPIRIVSPFLSSNKHLKGIKLTHPLFFLYAYSLHFINGWC